MSYGSNLLYHVNLQVHSIHRTLAVINLTPKSISEVKSARKIVKWKIFFEDFLYDLEKNT